MLLLRYVCYTHLNLLYNGMITQMFCSLPEAIGYSVSSTTSKSDPPIVCVVSEDSVHLIIFPFLSKDEHKDLLTTAVCIPLGSLNEGIYRIPAITMCFLVLLSHRQKRNLASSYFGKASKIPKRRMEHRVLMTEIERAQEMLEHERKQKEDGHQAR